MLIVFLKKYKISAKRKNTQDKKRSNFVKRGTATATATPLIPISRKTIANNKEMMESNTGLFNEANTLIL